jgi:hypothetical protein
MRVLEEVLKPQRNSQEFGREIAVVGIPAKFLYERDAGIGFGNFVVTMGRRRNCHEFRYHSSIASSLTEPYSGAILRVRENFAHRQLHASRIALR